MESASSHPIRRSLVAAVLVVLAVAGGGVAVADARTAPVPLDQATLCI